ncbi:DEAD/DEAH box helicase family protein [Roseomonas frigidaquae]|uniref:DEAD/DEAH box helicase family protein n=1 Tax=Falsiroseomonas frigidaquae TaxID=487318 RepID=A0ABX1F8H8_9PROT|nr:DEAD/DEAH box helicase family protein [Falsiroseomonas frigidaquae]NKE48630.1 DEAD/DEAH box helicase family protein [Falsiroseomonas frigidaquae]
MTQFAFLQTEFPEVFALARKAELHATTDARGACFHARLALETAVKWMYAHDRSLRSPYDTALSALIHEGTFRVLVGNALVAKARIIKDYGNVAAHETRAIPPGNAITAVRELFHFSYWLVRTYARGTKPGPGLAFDANALPRAVQVEASTLAKLQALAREREAAAKALEGAEAARIKSEADRITHEAEIARLQAEIAAIKQTNTAAADTHDYNEEQTRDAFIDLLLREAGWRLDQPRDREFPVAGMPNNAGEGFVDYVLWGSDGKPLAVIEAKRTRRDPRSGQQQAKLYADCMETQFALRPLIFYTNGYDHWLWDDERYPPRAVHGFMKRDELELWRQRKAARRSLSTTSIDADIVERYYQTRAIRRVGEVFEKDHQRRALLVMATGSGKTRTVIALIDQLMRANWCKRVLFLADRVALVRQAHNAFKKHLPSAPSANLIERHDPKKNDHHGARVCLSTYPTMMNLIDEMEHGQRRFGPGHFDLVVIDEAHRSIYRKYRSIFDYFDSLLVGLTATPRDEIDRDTYSLFELERGVPTDSYDLDQAVADRFLVPPRAISVPLRFVREGIKYDDLSEEEKTKWDALEWEGKLPASDVDASAVNKWLFNTDTVDKVLEHLMTFGIKVAGSDRLGKTIIFAKNHDHARFIAERFDANYPHLKGHFARVVDYQTEYAQSLIDDFSVPDRAPHIAISVDMLDTGIDVPEVVNLVFFKIVRSKTKFWQMIGRGTRLSPDLFGPGQNKGEFLIFDFCQNFEFFNQNPNVSDGTTVLSLSQRLFAARVEIASALQDIPEADRTERLGQLNAEIRKRLHDEVSGMSLDNFLVRAKRRAVEVFQQPEAWDALSSAECETLINEVAGLPTSLIDDDLAAKQFDLIVLSGQLSLLKGDATFVRCKEKVMAIAAKLESLGNVPMVAAAMALILEVQTDEFWQDIDAWSLEHLRRRLRGLIKLIEGEERILVYTDFIDEIGGGAVVALPRAGAGTDRVRFQMKAQGFLRRHLDHITIQKLRRNEQLTPQDLGVLERILVEDVGATPSDIDEARSQGGLGLFVRSIVGLECDAAKAAFADFLAGRNFNANQIEFVNMIIDYLTERGAMDPRRLYESPFTDFDDQGVSGLFPQADVQQIVQLLTEVGRRAAA